VPFLARPPDGGRATHVAPRATRWPRTISCRRSCAAPSRPRTTRPPGSRAIQRRRRGPTRARAGRST